MITETNNGLKLLKGPNGYEALFIDSSRIDDCINYLHVNHLKNISINPFQGYQANDLDFLSELEDYIEGIAVLDDKYDYAIVNRLHKLKSLGILDNKKDIIDLSNFPELQSLSCDYSRRLVSLESCEQLRNLTLTGFNPSDRTINTLPKLSSLNMLNLLAPNIVSLEGIDRFVMLREFTIFRASRLDDISELKAVKLTLSNLEFEQCRKISSYAVLLEMTNLEKLIIGTSSPIQSLSFVTSLPKLTFLSFVGTNVVDGDLSPAIGIEYVGFDDREHYSHKFNEISRAKAGIP